MQILKDETEKICRMCGGKEEDIEYVLEECREMGNKNEIWWEDKWCRNGQWDIKNRERGGNKGKERKIKTWMEEQRERERAEFFQKKR